MGSKKICGITGSTGVLGSEFIKKKYFKFIRFKGDITNKKDIDKWLCSNRFDLIVHFAAIVPTHSVEKDYEKALNINFIGTKYLIESIIKNKIHINWFFFASTSHVYSYSRRKIGEKSSTIPISKYGYTKLKAEKYITHVMSSKGIDYCIGRIFSFTSKKQKIPFLIPSIKKKIIPKKAEIIKFNNLNHYRDFLSTNYICKAIYFLWKKKFSGIINIASGQKIYLKNIVKFLLEKNKKKYRFIDNKISTSLIADISKIKSLGFKVKKINIQNIVN